MIDGNEKRNRWTCESTLSKTVVKQQKRHQQQQQNLTSLAGAESWPTWLTIDGDPASIMSAGRLSSGGGLGGNTEVSNFCNSAASVFGELTPLACPLGADRFRPPVLSEMLAAGTLIRREILTLGVLSKKWKLVTIPAQKDFRLLK